jgi:hypothetical protein
MADIVISDGFFPDGPPVREQYFAALCAESLRLGRISEAEHTVILCALSALLQERILLFTDGESTAVREETAQRILSSILYTISIALLAAGNHAAALAKLKNEPIAAIHDAGMRITMRTRTRSEVLALLMRRVCAGRKLSKGMYRFVTRTAYEYVRAYDPLYGSAETIPVRLDEMDIRESVCGIMRLAEIMTEVIKAYHR